MNRIGKKVMSGIALLTAIVLMISVFQGQDIQEVQAATRLHGIQQIVDSLDETDKFSILEIVPDKAYSSLGYYVSGSEPNIDEKLIKCLFDTNEKVISTDSEEGINARITAVLGYLAPVVTTYDIAEYEDAVLYSERLYYTSDMSNWNIVQADSGMTFSDIRRGYYVNAESMGLTVGDYLYVPDKDENGVELTTGTYQYKPGKGDCVWFDSADGELTVVQFEKIYYNVQVESNDWFAREVLELGSETTSDDVIEVLNHNVEVITCTPGELEDRLNSSDSDALTLADIDMIYLSNSTCLTLPSAITYEKYDTNVEYTTTKSNDLSWETTYNIYEYVVNNSMPIIADDSIVPTGVTVADLLTANNNIVRLLYLLKDFDAEKTLASYGELPSYLPTDATERETADATLGANLATKLSTADSKLGTQGKVAANVYINKTGLNLVNGGFTATLFTKTVGSDTTFDATVAGTEVIINEINSENHYYNVQNQDATSEFTQDTTGAGSHTIKVSQETFVKYILNFKNRRIEIYKDKITVLDIEPTKYSELTESDIRTWLGSTEASQKISEIEIVQMTSSEFIGKIDDLNEEYDLIYFGSCLGAGNTKGSMKQSGGVTNYYDNSMDGLIYTHVGDLAYVTERFGGLLATEYATGKTYLNNQEVETRFAGNDITETKLAQLKEYVDSGYPVIISDEFYSGSIINKNRVDVNSLMYEFMSSYTGDRAVNNVMKESNGQISVLATYINAPKLNLSIISKPTEYAITYKDTAETKIDAVDYLSKVGNKYVLLYTFEFSNTSEANSNANNYEIELFIDTNADGQYNASEELDALTITETSTGTEVKSNELKPNVRYTASRELPEDYVGILPWQLKISRVETGGIASKVRATTKGYTAIKTEATKVNVLQIASDYFHPYELILQDSTKYGTYYGESQFETFFADMKEHMGYDINIDVINVSDYVSQYTAYQAANPSSTVKDFYQYFYKDYDMIILGFEDCYSDIRNANAVDAIKMFINSGRSVLFSHDTTSFVNVDYETYKKTVDPGYYQYDSPWYHWGYYLNQYIRSDVGMDRYGVTDSELALLKKGQDLSTISKLDINGNVLTTVTEKDTLLKDKVTELNKDMAYVPNPGDYDAKENTVAQVQGFSNGTIDNNLAQGYTSIVYGNSGNNYESNSITQVNSGQITTFPYDINISDGASDRKTSGDYQMISLDKASIALTHCQYYQLDMNIDKDGDNKSDMVVWYCLGDNRNDAVPNDVRNNYYIYSVGNVTYTGMGHFAGGDTDAGNLSSYEAKLFINTIIASLNSGKKNPSVSIIADSTNKAGSLDYIYRTYDSELGLEDVSDVTVNFYATDMNIVNGKKELLVNYYYEITAAEYGKDANATYTTTKDEDGNTIYLQLGTTGNVTGVETVGNNVIAQFNISGTWINDQMEKNTSGNPLKVYVGVKTKITYNQQDKEVEYTEETYDCIVFKQRNLFNLD